ncbi:unnamed protein product [Peronospora belbahrii]|uniref:SPX domain-containing protein n=1 Tax=Peronospora belbahrii TaxID=622444 RepID=A0AAU9KLK1_9STRA|nr:unnamed protein product [Peronospora belbahrii]
MLRIANLLNNIGEDDSQLPNSKTHGHAIVSRSASERRTTVNEDQDAAMAMIAMANENEHIVSCMETKPGTVFRSNLDLSEIVALKTAGEGGHEEVAPMLSFYGSSQQLMTIKNMIKPCDVLPQRAGVGGKTMSTRFLFSELTHLGRRMKQRLIVKRCYYKKINMIETLRKEVDTLKQQFCLALKAIYQRDETPKAAGCRRDVKLRKMFISTLLIKETLREEHVRLRHLVDEHYMNNRRRLCHLLDSNHKGLALFTAVVDNDSHRFDNSVCDICIHRASTSVYRYGKRLLHVLAIALFACYSVGGTTAERT